MRYIYDGLSSYDVVYWLFVNDTLGQVLLQANDVNKSSGSCFWREVTADVGQAVVADVSLGTGYEYCWRAAEFSDGSIGAPAGILIAGAHDVHIASGGGVTEHPLDSTDFDDATRIFVDHSDRVFLGGRLQDYDADALGAVELTDPASSQILVSWPAQASTGPRSRCSPAATSTKNSPISTATCSSLLPPAPPRSPSSSTFCSSTNPPHNPGWRCACFVTWSESGRATRTSD